MVVVLICGLLSIIVDQLCKWWLLTYNPQAVVINNGLIFGLPANVGLAVWIVLIIMLGVLILLEKPKVKTAALFTGEVLIISGVLSNFIDRVTKSGVVDFLHFGKLLYFNLADIVIIVGIIIVCKKYVKLNS